MTMRKHSARARGFTMIEVLVALAVVAFGLLGLAKLQAVAISSAKVASSRSVAANLTEGIASSMHANTAYWQTSAAVGTATVTTAQVVSLGSFTDCTTATCTPVQMAIYDLNRFEGQVSGQLPAPLTTTTYPVSITCSAGTATYFSTNPNQCTITVAWSEQYTTTAATSASAPMPATQKYQMLIQP